MRWTSMEQKNIFSTSALALSFQEGISQTGDNELTK